MSAPKQDERTYRLRIFADINGLGPIARVEDQHGKPGPLEETVKLFHQYGFEPMSARDWAYACINLGIASDICQKPSTLRDGAAHISRPEPRIILVRETPMLEHHEYATHAHEAKLEFTIKKQLEEAYLHKINSNDKSVLEILKSDLITTKYFAGNKTMRYFFQDQVQDIGLLFDQNKIRDSSILIEYLEDVKEHKRPYVKNLWYGGVPGNHAIFSLRHRILHKPDILIWGTKIPEKNKIPKKF